MSAFSPILFDVLQTWTGKKVHVAGCAPGCVWRLQSLRLVNGVWMMQLVTPKTGKPFRAPAARAQYLRQDDPANQS